ncbi:MAG: fluoride efflux transporter CrcB [Betaproteobacteria bacterium]|nr:fluoride efflux transporter CrcB [Betaproteobacteria bacterium]
MRWLLALAFNPLFPNLPLGTLAANATGGFFIGVAVEYFTGNAAVPPEVKLLVVTGFLGGLTTFSTFSAEAVGLIAKQQIGWALAHAGAHLAASLTLTAAGIWVVRLMRG